MKETENQAEEQKKKTPGELFKSSSVTRYLRELSIVIIGVLITLWITGMINDYNRQKEITNMMDLVREELEENLVEMKWLHQKWGGEQHIWRLLQKNEYNPELIPEDSLRKYSYAIGAVHSLDAKKDSYDLLKSSFLIQYVKNKDLLRRLSKIHTFFLEINGQLSRYTDIKTVALDGMINTMEVGESELWLNGSVYDHFRFPLENKGFRKFLTTGQTMLPSDMLERKIVELEELIGEMKQMGY